MYLDSTSICISFMYLPMLPPLHSTLYFVTNFFFYFFSLQYRKGGGAAWVYFIDQKIPVNANSFIMRNLSADSTYSLKLAAKNELGMGEFDTYHSEVKTLKVKKRKFWKIEKSKKNLKTTKKGEFRKIRKTKN